ncbi:MAG: helix-turn-helix transcriptional regulator [Lachnospiraceae bacterium]|nr:helix-turn-helix transcriptional regulator [Lachnospiraceae bacterium]
MAEFGENLKRVREEKGITQQTLADQLYVTRQTVSRWEGGSRYPDLMTAKKMAQYLEVSLDDLLSDDDMKLYVQKSAILENPVAKRLQTIILTLAFMCSLVVSITYLSDYFIRDGFIRTYSETYKSLFLTVVLGFGVYAALFDKFTKKLTMIITILYFGMAIVTGIWALFKPATPWWLVAAILLNVVLLFVCVRFFGSNKVLSPIPVYALTAVYGLIGVVGFFAGFAAEIPGEIYRDVFKLNLFALLQNLLILGLLSVMAQALNRKRRLSM